MRVKKILRFLFLFCLVMSVCLVTACNRNNNGNMEDDNLNDNPNVDTPTNPNNNNDNNTNNGEINDPLNPMDPDDPINDPMDPIDPMIPDNGNMNGDTNNNGNNTNDNGNFNDDNIVPDNNLSTANPEINSVFEAVSNAYGEDFYADSERDETYLMGKIGVNMDDVESFFCNTATDTKHPDIFVGVKAKDSSAADSVETAFEDYRESLVNGYKADTSVNSHKVNSSEVIRHGNYVFLVMLGRTDDTITDVNDAMTFAKDQVKIAVDKIAEFFE
ncbi:MAG: DUF4358 domain-containing protein [Clostridia bacterium]|nr:DUF4358 domain-containing protein [Clostridia bacterium]